MLQTGQLRLEKSVSENYVAVVRRILCDILFEKVKYPILRAAYRRTTELRACDVSSLNLHSNDIPPSD